MKKNQQIVIGDWADGGPAEIDLPRFLETRGLVQGGSGAGKSYLFRRLIEQTATRIQQIVIDPEGEFSSLREKFDFVLCAPHGADAVAHPKTAELLAMRLLETGASAVIDLFELKVKKRDNERAQFIDIFLHTIVNAPKRLWHPVLIGIDEIQMYAPEAGEAVSADSIMALATLGRKRGFCLVGATPRIADFSKAAAAPLHNKIIGLTSLDTDIKRAAGDLGLSASDARDKLRHLNPGEFYAYGPAIGKYPRLMRTGEITTTHPKAGQRMMLAPPKPTAAIKALLPQLADLQTEAEQEARTATELRAENAKLKRDLKNATANESDKQDTEKVVDLKKSVAEAKKAQATNDRLVAILKKHLDEAMKFIIKVTAQDFVKDGESLDHEKIQEAMKFALKEVTRQMDAKLGEQKRQFEQWRKEGGRLLKGIESLLADGKVGIEVSVSHRDSFHVEAKPRHVEPKPRREPSIIDGEPITNPEQRILNAIAWLESTTRNEECNQVAVAFMAGYKYDCGGFNNPRGRLNQKGLVAYIPGEKIKLTDEGRALASFPESAGTSQELHERVLGRLANPEQRILKPLLAAYPESMTGEAVATAANYAYDTGGFNNPRGRLKSLGLIEYLGGGILKASPALFPDK